MKPAPCCLLFLIVIALTACQTEQKTTAPTPLPAPLSPETLLAEGESVYQQTCAMCHLDGSGSAVVPPLAGAPALSTRDPAALVRIITQGQSGRIERGGRVYNGIMPAMDYLSDRELAAVASYVRKNFGTDQTPVQPAEVASLRRSNP